MFTNKVDLCGYMHFWGLTVDVISAVDIIIAIGLCVDYAGAFFFYNPPDTTSVCLFPS